MQPSIVEHEDLKVLVVALQVISGGEGRQVHTSIVCQVAKRFQISQTQQTAFAEVQVLKRCVEDDDRTERRTDERQGVDD